MRSCGKKYLIASRYRFLSSVKVFKIIFSAKKSPKNLEKLPDEAFMVGVVCITPHILRVLVASRRKSYIFAISHNLWRAPSGRMLRFEITIPHILAWQVISNSYMRLQRCNNYFLKQSR